MFFDPNAGEYWFENKADFFDFFPEFYASQYYGFPLYFQNSWSVAQSAMSNTLRNKSLAY